MPPIPSKPVNCAPQFIVGDCCEEVPRLGEFDFIFADPPFNIGQNYQGYDDKKEWDNYQNFTRIWMDACNWAMNGRGVITLHGPDALVKNYLNFRDHRYLAWVNWHYRFGQCGRGNWIDARCHCLIYGNEGYTWNPESVLVESDRVGYGDKRINDTENGGERLPFTVWGIPSDGPYWGRVNGNNAERRPNHPNQLPVLYLARLIKAYTNPGDRVLDPFCGSGTTAAVCQELGRQCVTIDISAQSIESAGERCTDKKLRNVTRERLGLKLL
jgi:DNA modification methylase